MQCNILLVEADLPIVHTVIHLLATSEHSITRVTSAEKALLAMRETEFDLVLFPLSQQDPDRLESLRNISKKLPSCPVMVLSEQPDLATAIEALRCGAVDYLSPPLSEELFAHTLKSALRDKARTDLKERKRETLQGIVSSVSDAIVTVDQLGRFTYFNPAALSHFDLSVPPLGSKPEQLKLPCGNNCLRLLTKVLEDGITMERYRQTCQNPERPGLIVTTRVHPLLSDQGQLRGAVLILREETLLQKSTPQGKYDNYHNLVGQSPEMQHLYSLLDKLAQVSSTVLLSGESGTGKERVAEALHYKGSRRNRPFVRVNCAGLSETLLDSELFGHTKGAFTGAVKERSGRFEMAQGGTIFLDEIGDISPNLQLKLLRVLQEKEIERLGDATPIPVDVRIIAATHQDLKQKIRLGLFREDLYFRLKVIHLRMPSLRQRPDDLPLLVDHFIDQYCRQFNKAIIGASEKVQQVFAKYTWPGNVRELKHALEHAFIFNETGLIDVDDLPLELREASPTAKEDVLPDTQNEIEQLRAALTRAGGNKAKAARLLNISRQTLYRKLRQHDIDVD